MKPREVIELCRQLQLNPSRRLGQNFLTDPNILRRIVEQAGVQPGELLLEVGPGLGVLTAALLERGAEVLAIEFDYRLAAHLRQRYAGEPRLRLEEADACRVDYDVLTAGRPWACVANLPYSISTVVLARILTARNLPNRLVVMLQREMADRLAASPSTKDYGALSVNTQLLYVPALVAKVAPGCFWPQPAVHSAVLRLQRRPELPAGTEIAAVRRLARAGFAQRRKRLAKLLGAEWSPGALEAAWQAAGLSSDVRAEELTPAQFLGLARLLAGAA